MNTVINYKMIECSMFYSSMFYKGGALGGECFSIFSGILIHFIEFVVLSWDIFTEQADPGVEKYLMKRKRNKYTEKQRIKHNYHAL